MTASFDLDSVVAMNKGVIPADLEWVKEWWTVSHFVGNVCYYSPYYSWTTLLLDMELVWEFCKSETNRDIKKSFKYHQNNLKSYDDFEILRTLAQKLRAWRLFVF